MIVNMFIKPNPFKPEILKAIFLAFAVTIGFTSIMQAQPVNNRVIAFGDSLSDNGNLFAVSGQPQAPYNQRFSNGKVWVEYFAGPLEKSGAASLMGKQPMGHGNLDFAFGGSRTDSFATPSLGIQAQIDGFATLGGRFTSTDIATLWGGANDLLQGISATAGNPNTSRAILGKIAKTAGTNITNQVRQLIELGAKTIIVNTLPDFSSLPQFSGSPLAPLAGFGSSTFNADLTANLKNLADTNPDVKIMVIDISEAFSSIVFNESTSSLTNTAEACVTVAACLRGGSAMQKKFLFWDGIHPTDEAHRLLAVFIYNRLKAEKSVPRFSIKD